VDNSGRFLWLQDWSNNSAAGTITRPSGSISPDISSKLQHVCGSGGLPDGAESGFFRLRIGIFQKNLSTIGLMASPLK